jgi:hypothetical protein
MSGRWCVMIMVLALATPFAMAEPSGAGVAGDPQGEARLDALPRADVREAKSISQYGITWTFAEPAQAGQFVTGDWWVIGPVRVVRIDPKSENDRNGSMVNPRLSTRQGYDKRIQFGEFAPDLNVAAGISGESPLVLEVGTSLISSISREDGKPRPFVETMAVLTVLDRVPPKGAFRPPAVGEDKTVRYTVDLLKREKLKSLAATDGAPSATGIAAWFERPWVDHVGHNAQAQFQSPAANMPNYGQQIAERTSQAVLRLNTDLPVAEKEPILISLVQVGIDLYAVTQQERGQRRWTGGGGHNSGRKLPILFAGVMLGDEAMTRPTAHFGEDTQTYFGQGWTGATALWSPNHVTRAKEDYEHKHPREWTVGGRGRPGDPRSSGSNSDIKAEDYRRSNTGVTFVGTALAAQIMGLQETWNHPPLFAYAERWMTEDDAEFVGVIKEHTGKAYKDFARQGHGSSTFINTMWKAYWKPLTDDQKRPAAE